MSKQVNRVPSAEPNRSTGMEPYPNAEGMLPFGTPIRNPFPPAGSNPFAAANAADPPYQPEPRFICLAEYEASELVLTIRGLVNNSHNDAWSGTASEILAAGQQEMRLADATARQIDQQIKDLEPYLRIYDGIYYYCHPIDDVMQHGFFISQPGEDGVRRSTYTPGRPQKSASRHVFQSAAAQSGPALPEYQKGDMLEHKAFGQGMVLSAQKMEGDVLLEIAFDNVGTKRLLLKFTAQLMKKL